jgi:hypothetical protein
MINETANSLANHEIVTLAVYLLGGDTQRIDAEDIAVKANDLAPQRFTWRKYPNQINLEAVRKRLWDARQTKKGGYLVGSDNAGWSLTPSGILFAKNKESILKKLNLARKPLTAKERNLVRREHERLLGSAAFEKFLSGEADKISVQEAESFFRVDAYVTGEARTEKILRTKNRFGGDAELGSLIKLLESKLSKEGGI